MDNKKRKDIRDRFALFGVDNTYLSIIGMCLLKTVREAYEPKTLTEEELDSWNKCYVALCKFIV
jgi:hemoglobin-like flavoprotein